MEVALGESTQDEHLVAKEQALRGVLAGAGSALVAFSGGADSAYLAWAATAVLGGRALCVTADSPSYPARHRALAVRVAHEFGLHHAFIKTAEMDYPAYRANHPDRCYHCKHETILGEFETIGYRYVTLDLQGYRTGSLNEGLQLRPV